MRAAVGFNEMGDVMAEVFSIWSGVDRRHHAALSHDFDPGTDDVVVVKKDAARVWVEGWVGKRFMHGTNPSRNGNSWQSPTFKSINELSPCVCDGDCVEFIAVKTHRPPVAQEVAEAVPELSDEAKVKAVYPDAMFTVFGDVRNAGFFPLSGFHGMDEQGAWADAARRLETKPEPVSHHKFGCGVEVVSGAVLAN